jgi:transcriptional regulator with XRE-family HTH domain
MVFRTGASPDHRAVETQIDDEMLAFGTELINEINWYMRERDLTRAELAERMRVSPGRVSQILSGGENLTLRTLAALSTALDARFSIELLPVKDGDIDPSPDPVRAAAAPAGNHHAASRATHRGVRPRSLSLCRLNRAHSGRRDACPIAGERSGSGSRTSRTASTSPGASSRTRGRAVTRIPGARGGRTLGGSAAGADLPRVPAGDSV